MTAIAALTAAALSVSSSTQAATQTWDGAASGVWDTSALNWGGAAWTNGNDALFTGTPTNNVTTATGLTIGNITLASTFTGSVTMSGNNTMSATTTTTISGGTLNLNATGGLGGSVVAIGTSGTVNVTANGAIANIFTGTGVINVTNTANTPNFNNTASFGGFTGTFNVNTSAGQKVQLSGAAATIGSGATVNIASQGTLYVSGAGATFNGVTFNLAGTGNTEGLGALRLDGNTVIGSTSSIVLGGTSSTTTQLGGNAGTSVINAVISESVGSRSVEKVGTGTMVLGANNTYTGATILTGGTLSVSTDSAGAYNLGGSGANGITFNGGTLQILGTTMTSFGSHTPTFNATKTVGLDINNAANTFTVSQNLNQTTGGLTKAGDGTLTLTGTSSYTGTTTIQGGTLNVGNGTSGTLGTGALTFNTNGGTANFNEAAGSSQTMGALTFGGGAGTVKSTYGGSGTTTLTFASLAARTAGATGNFVSSGGVNGTDNIIKFTSAPAAGALIDKGYYFNGADFAAYDSGGFVRALAYGTDTNTSAVDTIASATHVKLTASPAGQNSISLLTLNLSGSGTSWTNNASQTLTLSNGGLIKSGGGSATISGGTGITTGGATEFVIRTDTASDSLDIQTPILSTSTAGLTKTGAGTLILSGTGNAYTGATTVDEGTLSLSGTLTGGGAITIKSGATFSETGTGIISGASSLTSSGTTTLAGVNTYTGATTVSGGTLTVSGSGTLGGGSAVLNLSGGKLDLGGTSQSVGAITISAAAASGNTIQNGTLTGAGALTVSHTIGNAIVSANLTRATLAQSGAGTLTLSGTNAFSGNIGANAGNMAITGTTTVDGGAVNNTGFISVLGGATVTVSSGGSLNILGSTGTKPGSFIGQNSSGTLTVDGGSFTVGGNNNFGIGNNNYGAVGTLNINSGTATITAANAGALNIIAMGRDNATGIINLNGGTLATGRQFVRDGSNGGKQGAGTAIFNFNGGTLKALANQTSGNGWFETATTTDNQVVTTTVKAGGAKIDTNGFDANINTVLAHDSGLGATLDGGLTKSGTGTLALGAANTYTGGTTVNAGTLSVGNNSALGTGGVTVNTGGTLLIQQGFNVSNAVTLAGGAYNKNIATSTAYAYVSTSSFAGGQANTTASLVAGTTGAARSLSTSFADTSAASNDGIRTSDVFNLSGTGTDSFTLQLQVAGITSDSILGWNNAGTWVNAVLGNSTSGALAGSYAMGWNTFLANNGGSFNGTTMLGAYGYDTTNNTVWAVLDHNSEFAVVTAVPEPSTFALMGFGVAALVFLRRRARSSSDSSS